MRDPERAPPAPRLPGPGQTGNMPAWRLYNIWRPFSIDARLAKFIGGKGTEEEKAARAAAIEEATLFAAKVPLKTMEAAFKALPLALQMAEKGNPASASDAGVAALAALAGIRGAELNVRINAAGLQDKSSAQPLIQRAAQIVKEATELEKKVLETVNKHIDE